MDSNPPQLHPYHRMEIHEDEATLAEVVSALVLQAHYLGLPALIIATASFRARVVETLKARDIDLEHQPSQIEILDSESVLNEIMAGGSPDPARFKQVIGATLDRLCAGRKLCMVAIYSDMVDVLVRDANAPAALKMEMLWNRLAEEYSFSLVCGYSAAGLREHVPTLEELQAICDEHNLRSWRN